MSETPHNHPDMGFDPNANTVNEVMPVYGQEAADYLEAAAWHNSNLAVQTPSSDEALVLAQRGTAYNLILDGADELRDDPKFGDMSLSMIARRLQATLGSRPEGIDEPTARELQRVLHGLVNDVSPGEAHSVIAEYRAAQAAAQAAEAPPEVDPSVEAARRLVQNISVSGTLSEHPSSVVETQPAHAERHEAEPNLAELVVEAAKGSAIIHMDTPPEIQLHFRNGDYSGHAGFKTFGDGSFGDGKEVPSYLRGSIGGYNRVITADGTLATDMVEAVGFVPVTIQNPQTGQEEQAVYFDYAYNPGLNGGDMPGNRLGLPMYKESMGGRTGGMLITRVRIPVELADTLRSAIEENPGMARTVVEKIVLDLGGVTPETWQDGAVLGSARQCNRLKPPYEGLPASHRLFMVEMGVEPDPGYRGAQVPTARRVEKPVNVSS